MSPSTSPPRRRSRVLRPDPRAEPDTEAREETGEWGSGTRVAAALRARPPSLPPARRGSRTTLRGHHSSAHLEAVREPPSAPTVPEMPAQHPGKEGSVESLLQPLVALRAQLRELHARLEAESQRADAAESLLAEAGDALETARKEGEALRRDVERMHQTLSTVRAINERLVEDRDRLRRDAEQQREKLLRLSQNAEVGSSVAVRVRESVAALRALEQQASRAWREVEALHEGLAEHCDELALALSAGR